MSIAEQIKAASITARREKAPSAVLLVTVLAAIQRIGKDNGNRDTTDDEAIKVLKSFVENAKFTKNALIQRDASADTSEQDREIAVLQEFIPAQLSEERLRQEIAVALAGVDKPYTPKHMGLVMKHLNGQFKGLFDGGAVKSLFEAISKE